MYFSFMTSASGQPRWDTHPRVGLLMWLQRSCLMIVIALGVSACERDGALLTQSQYAEALVGEWQGNVGDDIETISFSADGRFNCQMLPTGFIGATLGQREPGAIDGEWALRGEVITLSIDHASNEQPLNLATTSIIVSFHQNQLVVKSSGGQTSTFTRKL